MRVLVTGAAGFIGSWLVPELINRGHYVIGVDHAKEIFGDGLPQDMDQIRSDLTDPLAISDVVDPGPYGRPIDAVVHLAAQVGREFGENDAAHTVRNNAQMTAQVAKVCGERGIPVLYTSTSEVYGDQRDAVCDEYHGPFSLPHNLYGLSKKWGEDVLQLYNPERTMVARLSMPYGPGAPPGRGRRAMDNFLWWAHHRQPITVHRNSERSWCWVGDTVRALALILENGQPGVWNVGRDDDPLSMKSLATIACSMAGAPYDLIEEVDPPARQTVVKRLSTQRIRDLGWNPTVEIETGMGAVYQWVQKFDANGMRVEW